MRATIKTCKQCGATGSVGELFSPKKYTASGVLQISSCALCKSCNRAYMRNYRQSVKGKAQTTLSERKKRLKFNYGLTIEEHEHLKAQQNNQCAICYIPLSAHPSTDHNHKTNRVRGILCRECNIGLGMFKDSRVTLASAILYLSRDV